MQCTVLRKKKNLKTAIVNLLLYQMVRLGIVARLDRLKKNDVAHDVTDKAKVEVERQGKEVPVYDCL